MKILIIGGTRNLGHLLTHQLLDVGHRVTVLNRGKTRDELPERVERLHADRTDAGQFERALDGRTFDVVVDNVLYNGHDAEVAVRLLAGKTGHYIFASTGQVYLVREGVERPFTEESYEGRLMPAPKSHTYGYEEWTYGIEKRHAEDTLALAWQQHQFLYTSLRLPMVNGERDHFSRLYSYILRLKDGGPVLAPTTPNYPLRHVYAGDVVRALMRLIDGGAGPNRVYNIAQDETLSLESFLDMLAGMLGVECNLIRVKRDLLEANGFLPDCSPFSERWMSELDNTRGKTELGLTYTPLRDYLAKIVAHFEKNPLPPPASYRRRHAERMLAAEMQQGAK
jgi:nucleoside-diphosphate-sugar epimerase